MKSPLKPFNLNCLSYDIKQLFIDRKNVKSVTDTIKKDRPKLTISVGTKATKLLQTKLRRQPILFTMVFRPDRTELVKSLKFPGTNATGVARYST